MSSVAGVEGSPVTSRESGAGAAESAGQSGELAAGLDEHVQVVHACLAATVGALD